MMAAKGFPAPASAWLLPRERDAIRNRLAEAVERLIALLDAIDGEPHLEPYLADNGERITDDREGDYSDLEPEEDDNGDTGIADLDALRDPDLCWMAKGLKFEGTGTALARALMASTASAVQSSRPRR